MILPIGEAHNLKHIGFKYFKIVLAIRRSFNVTSYRFGNQLGECLNMSQCRATFTQFSITSWFGPANQNQRMLQGLRRLG